MDSNPLSRLRRNHGLEHATLHVLAERHPGLALGGFSDFSGFFILGDLSLEDLASAVGEALSRLNCGERKLAVHPNCGTNYASAGLLAGLAAAAAMFGVGKRPRDNFERLPLAISFATLALILAQPLGLFLQETVTTSGSLGRLRVTQINPLNQGRLVIHRIFTQD